ncbi:Intermediate filament protein [Boothiomyces macroporosus]|uniref:Intermediate filament protein n=1 Tax=Boothiomyces macroporosus TaxID=261099 RepID=A0AAD5ULM9_9FUNG|nr:Intermediate filament protein [Boothiomyces macroporosus]
MTTLEKLLETVDWRIALGIMPFVYLMPWTFFTVLLVISAFLLGILFEEANVQDGGGIALISQHYQARIQPINEEANAKFKESIENRVLYPRPEAVSPELEAVLNKFISNIVRDFINGWYNNFNVSKKTDFPDAIQSALFDSFVTLGNSARKINPTNLILSTMESVIQHVKEYREFDMSGLDMQDYLKMKPESRFNRFNSRKAVVDHLCEQSMKLIIHILPRADRNSPALFAIVQEIVATTVLLPIIDKITNPDFINESLLNALKKKTEQTKTVQSQGKTSLNQIIENEGNLFDFQSFLNDENLFKLNLFIDIQEARKMDKLQDIVIKIKNDEYGKQLLTILVQLNIEDLGLEELALLEKNIVATLDIQADLFVAQRSVKMDVDITKENSEYYPGSVDRARFLNGIISNLESILLDIGSQMGSSDAEALSQLVESKLSTQSQLEEFRELLVQEQESPLQKKLFDIHGAKLSVTLEDITKSKKESSIMSLGFMNTISQNFEINVVTDFNNWTVVKSEGDFEQLSKTLNNHFARIQPLKPDVKGFISKTSEGEYQAKAQEFSTFLQQLNGDPVVKHSIEFISFLQPVEVKKLAMKKSSSWIDPNISMKKVLSSASIGIGSALKRVTEATTVTESPISMEGKPEVDEQLSDSVDRHLGSNGSSQTPLALEDFDEDEIVFNSSISKEDLNIILDVTFTTIEELFSLNQSNQWMRQQSLHLIKVVLKRMFGKKLSSAITSKLDQASTGSSICTTIDSLTENLWPDGRPWGSGPQIPPKTTYETERIKHQLFCLINKQEGMQRSEEFEKAVVSIQNLLGNVNTTKGLLRGFFLVQNQHLSAGLCCEIIESIVNMITSN